MRIGLVGAGAIGSYLAARLAARGATVTLLGRRTAETPITAVNLDGSVATLPQSATSGDPRALGDVDICALTVKAKDLPAVAALCEAKLRPEVPVIALQNGLGHVERLREAGLTRPCFAGLVTFNVVVEGSRYSKATSGPIALAREAPAAPFADALEAAGEPVLRSRDIRAHQTGKLLLNLNNGVCAALGISIRDSVRDRRTRRLFAMCIREGLQVFGDQPIAALGPLSPRLIERALRLPDAIFSVLARPMISIDPRARSSTLTDLERGRPTEIEWLNGGVVKRGAQRGIATPVNAAVVDAVRAVEAGGPHASVDALLRAARTR